MSQTNSRRHCGIGTSRIQRAWRKLVPLAAMGGIALMSWQAAAQTVPPSVDPGRVPGQLQPPPRDPGVAPGVRTPTLPTQTPPDRAREIKFVLRNIVITGGTVYSQQQIAALYQGMIGREVTLLEVYGIANQITAKYRNDGYVLSQAVVPQQQIRDGSVTIQIVEGRINRIIIRDEGKASSLRFLLQYGERIKAATPLTQSVLEHYLLLMNDLPGVTVTSTLAPSDAPGTADLIIEAKYKAFDLFASVDNRGSRFLGPYQVEAGGAVNALWGTGDRLAYRGVSTAFQPRELMFHELRYITTLTEFGTTLDVSGTYTRTRPGFTLKFLEIEGESWTWAVRLRQPLIRSRQMNLWVWGGFDWRNSETRLLDSSFSDDRLRTIRYGATFEVVDQLRGANAFDVSVSHGVDVFGARGNSREFGRTNFTKVNFDYQRNQQIYGPVTGFVAFTGQYAANQLLAPEEFGLGGRSFGRAFDPSEKTGDHGFGVTVELRYTIDGLKIPGTDWSATLQPYAFGDWGRVYHINDNARKTFEALASAGVGVRFNAGPYFTGQVEGAVPLYNRVSALGSEGNNWRLFFVLNARY